MKRIILCEGKTDAILISYFLERRFGWRYQRSIAARWPAVSQQNEEVNWYVNAHRASTGQELVIWSGGGITQIPEKLAAVTHFNQRNPSPEDRFEAIVLFFDHDEPTEVCLKLVSQWILKANLILLSELQLGEWINAELDFVGVTPPGKFQLRLLALVLPPNRLGALETFLIDCWQQFSEADAHLVRAARTFIGNLPELTRQTYLNHRRLPDKACLGSILSVASPDGIFTKIDPRLKSVPWEKIEAAQSIYGKLEAL